MTMDYEDFGVSEGSAANGWLLDLTEHIGPVISREWDDDRRNYLSNVARYLVTAVIPTMTKLKHPVGITSALLYDGESKPKFAFLVIWPA